MMNSVRRSILLTLSIILCVIAQISSAVEQVSDSSAWAKVQDKNLRIAPGSVLDFSGQFGAAPKVANSPIGTNSQGQLALNNGVGERIRFLCATLLFGGPHGPLPDHGAAEDLATQLRMHGYNLVRFHYIDEALMEGRRKDFDYDPEALDKFHYLLAALKQQGIYWMMDAATSEQGAYAGTEKNSSAEKRNVRLAMHIEPDAQAHWKNMVATILGQKNPYTRQSVLNDPALAVVTVMNETGLEYLTRAGYQEELQQPFRDWLHKKYKNPARLKTAWNDSKLNSMNDVSLPAQGEVSPRVTDLLKFFSDLERGTLQWTTAYLRKQGYQGLVTSYNNGRSVYSRAVGQDLKLVTQHGYFDHPSDFIRPDSAQIETSSLDEKVPYARDFASSRFGGRPFIVDEYDHPFWSPWRREAGITIPAYAALQGWDGIARFANPVELDYGQSRFQRHTLINPFGIGMDPVARAGETLAALLFRRMDIRPAHNSVALKISESMLFNEGRGRWRPMPNELSAIGLVTGLGLQWTADGATKSSNWKPDFSLPLMPDSRSRMHKAADKIAEKMGKEKRSPWADNVEALRASGILEKHNRTDTNAGIYESDTGEILLESRERRMSVITPNTEATVFDDDAPLTLSQLTIESASSPALIAVSSVNGNGLAASKRMLIIFATDAQNSGMHFSNGRKILKDLGRPPIIMLTARVTITLRHESPQDLRLYSTALNGSRVDVIPTEKVAGGLRFTLDTGKLSHGPTTYFELVNESLKNTATVAAKEILSN